MVHNFTCNFCESTKLLKIALLEKTNLILKNTLHYFISTCAFQIIEGEDSSDELNEMLRQNCFDLADSFCLYSVDKTALNNAAGYFVLSGRPISDVVQHIKKKYSDVSINEGREREGT